ncbi:hypothetical protein, partial [Vibrio hyugaensis]|uniref:hypothetical protein n=1 Tax=Vibrio hyugaensis TaxID=1534743 RepID=UPI001CA554FF
FHNTLQFPDWEVSTLFRTGQSSNKKPGVLSGFYFFYKIQKYSLRSVPITAASVIVIALKN